ncbi:unnamed protein product, partial [Oppiella nova]
PTPGVHRQTSIGAASQPQTPDYDLNRQIIYTTLIRKEGSLGFSIAGGIGGTPYKEGSEGVHVSNIVEGGAAHRDGKLSVGDRVLSINGADVEHLTHEQVVAMLTGVDRFVRLVVEHEGSDTSPKMYGMGRPYTGLYASSYMANRPSYTGSYRRPTLGSVSSLVGDGTDAKSAPVTPTTAHSPGARPQHSIYTKLPGLRNNDAVVMGARSSATLPANHTVTTTTSAKRLSSSTSDGPLLSVTIQKPELVSKFDCPLEAQFPAAPTGVGVFTEVITKTTYTENVVTRVTNNILSLPPIEEVSLPSQAAAVSNPHPPPLTVTLIKSEERNLGLSIIGGSDHSCHPFGGSEPGIFVSKVVADGPAHRTGKIRIGDRLIAVNGVDVSKATHNEAVGALLRPAKELMLTIRHEPLPIGWKELIIHKLPTEKLGMNVKGGATGQPGNPMDKDDEGVFISKINANGAAARDGRLRPGMRIIEVNETSLLGATHQESVHALRNAGNKIVLLVCDGYDTADTPQKRVSGVPETPTPTSPTAKSFKSFASPDREEDDVFTATPAPKQTPPADRVVMNNVSELSTSGSAPSRVEPVVNESSSRSRIPVPTSNALANNADMLLTESDRDVNQKVIEVVKAAEQLSKQTTNQTTSQASKEQKTTTVIMKKHNVNTGSGVATTPPTITPPVSTRVTTKSPIPTNPSSRASTPARDSPSPGSTPRSRSSTPIKTRTPSPILKISPLKGWAHDQESGSPTSPMLDPYQTSKIPGAKPPKPDKPPKPRSLALMSQQKSDESPEWLTFSEKKRRFEQGLRSSTTTTMSTGAGGDATTESKSSSASMNTRNESYSESKRFSYLSADELERLREEETKKFASLSEEQIKSLMSMAEEDDDDEDETGELIDQFVSEQTADTVVDEDGRRVFRTAKSERRYRERVRKIGGGVDPEQELLEEQLQHMTPNQRRVYEAEKRRLWREARLQSLEGDRSLMRESIAKAKEASAAEHLSDGSPKLRVIDIDIDVHNTSDKSNRSTGSSDGDRQYSPGSAGTASPTSPQHIK